MTVKNLKHIDITLIVDCLLVSFADYVVKMPADVEFWRNRWLAARVNYALSFGMFDKEKLIGFIINGIDTNTNKLTAFNSGTGVIPDYRGNKVVDKIYEHAMPLLKKEGVERCTLEVIKGNDRAIRVYERIGFTKKRQLKCFKGAVESTNPGISIEKVNFDQVLPFTKAQQALYSWDNVNQAILLSNKLYDTYLVKNDQEEAIAYFLINPKNGYLPQFELINGDFKDLLSGIGQVTSACRINNVDTSREKMIQDLLDSNFKNDIDQFEMEMDI